MDGDQILFATNHVIPDPAPINKREQDKQFIKPIKFKVIKRFHIGLWSIGDKIIAGIHIDALRVLGHL